MTSNSTGRRFILEQIFGEVIARALCGNSSEEPEEPEEPEVVLLSADGYILTDVNGTILIPKE